MAHYTETWKCRVCSMGQGSDGAPKSQVCRACLTPLAKALLFDAIPNATLATPGIDTDHWYRRAEDLACLLMRHWSPRA